MILKKTRPGAFLDGEKSVTHLKNAFFDILLRLFVVKGVLSSKMGKTFLLELNFFFLIMGHIRHNTSHPHPVQE